MELNQSIKDLLVQIRKFEEDVTRACNNRRDENEDLWLFAPTQSAIQRRIRRVHVERRINAEMSFLTTFMNSTFMNHGIDDPMDNDTSDEPNPHNQESGRNERVPREGTAEESTDKNPPANPKSKEIAKKKTVENPPANPKSEPESDSD